MSRIWMAAACLALMSLGRPASAQSLEQGWVARFVWSPNYCARTRDSRELQCRRQNGFLLDDLARVSDGSLADDCRQGAALSDDLFERILRVTQNRMHSQLIWRRQGRCSGLSEADFASYVGHVDRRMSWPAGFQPGAPELVSTPREIVAALTAENPGLPEAALVLHCKRQFLQSVSVCLDGSFGYSADRCPLDSNCGDTIRLQASR